MRTRLQAALKRARGDRLVESVIRDMRRLDERVERGRAGLSKQVRTLTALDRRVQALDAALCHGHAPGTSDQATWGSTTQSGELAFHARNAAYRGDDAAWWKSVTDGWREWGLEPSSWAGRTVVDLGAGSRLRTLWFDGIELIVIEPLADRFRAEIPWSDLDRAAEVYSVPGETLVPEVAGRADVVTSINALDHGYDLRASIANVRRYLKPDGEALIAIDMHDRVSDEMHPMIVEHSMMLELFAAAGLEVISSVERARYHGGIGPGARHYRLRPRVAATV